MEIAWVSRFRSSRILLRISFNRIDTGNTRNRFPSACGVSRVCREIVTSVAGALQRIFFSELIVTYTCHMYALHYCYLIDNSLDGEGIYRVADTTSAFLRHASLIHF